MNKTISHYVARFDLPGYKKGQKAHQELCERFPDVFEPIYKEDPVIPPGILSFSNENVLFDIHEANYDNWAQFHVCQNSTIHAVSDRGTKWSVGEQTNRGEIEKFYWDYDRGLWKVAIRNPTNDPYCWLHDLRKLPTRTPICQLPDENGKLINKYQGEKAYCVDRQDWEIGADTIHDKWDPISGFEFFATRAAAEKYVLDKQPFYPRGDVELIMDYYEAIYGCTHPISNLKAFKEAHLKDKV